MHRSIKLSSTKNILGTTLYPRSPFHIKVTLYGARKSQLVLTTFILHFLRLNLPMFLSIKFTWRKMCLCTQNIKRSQHFNFHEWGSMKANTLILLDKGRHIILLALYVNDDKWRCWKLFLKNIRLLSTTLTYQNNYAFVGFVQHPIPFWSACQVLLFLPHPFLLLPHLVFKTIGHLVYWLGAFKVNDL